jgi:hypothetical protein
MAEGPGKYDDLCTYVRTAAVARGVVLVVVDGDLGSGFSVQVHSDLRLTLPVLLRRIADDIEEDSTQ